MMMMIASFLSFISTSLFFTMWMWFFSFFYHHNSDKIDRFNEHFFFLSLFRSFVHSFVRSFFFVVSDQIKSNISNVYSSPVLYNSHCIMFIVNYTLKLTTPPLLQAHKHIEHLTTTCFSYYYSSFSFTQQHIPFVLACNELCNYNHHHQYIYSLNDH